MSRRPGMPVILGLGLAALAIGVAVHQAPHAATSPHESAASPGTAGMRAFLDPETGELRGPTAEELAHSAHDHALDLGKLPEIEVIEHANGMKSAVLDERFMSTSVAKVGPDGRLVTDCVTTPEQRETFFANAGEAEVQ